MSNTFEISVPCTCENTTATYAFTLTPSLPVAGEKSTWPTIGYVDGELKEVDVFSFKFDTADTSAGVPEVLENEQSVVLMISINAEMASDWEFFGNGTEMISAYDNSQYDVCTQVLDPKTLKIKISQVPQTLYSFGKQPLDNLDTVIKVTPEENNAKAHSVDFRYVLKHLPTGDVYMSQDPMFASRR